MDKDGRYALLWELLSEDQSDAFWLERIAVLI